MSDEEQNNGVEQEEEEAVEEEAVDEEAVDEEAVEEEAVEEEAVEKEAVEEKAVEEKAVEEEAVEEEAVVETQENAKEEGKGKATHTIATEDDRKVFIGGLSWSTKEAALREYFGTYGEITSINIKTDPHTGRSRGFAFVIFKEPTSVNKVIEEKTHTIDGRKVEPHKAKKRYGKIFVKGLKDEIEDEDIKTHFSQFGKIVEVVIPKDKAKDNARKNFCFVEFEEEQVAKDLVKESKTEINGIHLDIKRVTPKYDATGGGGRGGRGGSRGGRGGYGMGYGGGHEGGYGYGGGYDGGYGYGGGYDGYGGGYGGGGGGYGGGYGGGGGYSSGGGYGGGGYGGGGRGGGRGYRHSPY